MSSAPVLPREQPAAERDPRASVRAADRPGPSVLDRDEERLELSIGGMTCAACARRVERRLNKLDGVVATVSYPTDRAVLAGLPARRSAEAVAAVEAAGYTAQVRTRGGSRDDEWSVRASTARLALLRRRLFVAAMLMVPLGDATIILALVPGLRFPGWEAVCVALAIPVVTWCAWPFHRAALNGLRHRATSMDTLVSLGIIASFGWAVITLALGDGGEPGYWLGFGVTPSGANALYLDVAAGLTTFQLAGRYFETRARRRAGDVLAALADLVPTTATVVRERGDGVVETADVPVAALRRGDAVVVLPGQTVPVDGTVLEGRAALDTAAMTGEPLPVDVGPGDDVVGGAVAADGRLVVRAREVGAHTQLAQMAAMAEDAQVRRAGVQTTVDRIVAVFVPAVLVLSAVVLLVWLLLGNEPRASFGAAVAVLIIACPCALGMATPTALMVGVGRGSQLGILVKGQDALEASGRVDTVVLDKTGTLTTGEFRLAAVVPTDRRDAHEVLALAAAVEAGSEHLLGRAIVAAARDTLESDGSGAAPDGSDAASLPAARGFTALPGLGARAEVAGAQVVVGSPALAREHADAASDWSRVDAAVQEQSSAGRTAVTVVVDGVVVAVLGLADRVRPSAGEAVEALHALGLRTVMLTGDAEAPARAVAARIGITDVLSGVLPADKAAAVAALRAQGATVAVVGDGVNDAAALATGDLGMAMVDGTDIAMRSADVILVRRDLTTVADAITLSRRTLRTIRGNLVWALGYNVVAIPLAAAGLLNPLIAAAAMSASSVLVVTNSLRLRNVQPVRDVDPVTGARAA